MGNFKDKSSWPDQVELVGGPRCGDMVKVPDGLPRFKVAGNGGTWAVYERESENKARYIGYQVEDKK